MVRGREAYFTCPFCGKPQRRRKFSINVDSGLWRCWSCDEHGAYRGLATRLGQPGEAPSPRPRPEADPLSGLAPPEKRDRAYSALLEALALEEEHRGDLRIRGFSDAEIEAGGYRTLPAEGRLQLAAQMEAILGTTGLDGVPGFYRSGPHCALSGPACYCLLIPVRNEQGLVVGIQIRPDGVTSGGKYRWLSSRGLAGGTPAHAELHFAWPTGRPDPRLRQAWVTEGPLKAHALACRVGVLAVAVPGVGLWRTTDLIHRLRELGMESVVVAYDADVATKLPVAKATEALADGLLLNGSEVSIATWDLAVAKGADDLLLLTDQRPRLLNLRDWRERLPESVRTRLPRRRGAVDIPAEEMPPPPPLQPVITLGEARSQIGDEISTVLRQPYARAAQVFADPPGAGKTAAWIHQLIALRRDGPWPKVDHWLTDEWGIRRKVTVPMRLVGLFPNRQAMLEAYRSRPELAEFVCLQEGRTADPDSEWCCRNFEAAQQLGARRHSVRLELCPDCPFFEGCPYLASLERARQADVVFAVHQSFLNAADELGADWRDDRRPAHTVILEEEFLPELVEDVSIDLGCLSDWAGGLRDQPEMASAGQIIQVLTCALSATAARRQGDPIPALPLLRQAAPTFGCELETLLREVDTLRDDEDRRYATWPFERPYHRRVQGTSEPVVPLRVFADLLRVLREELADTRRPDQETRLWLGSQQSPSGRREPALLLRISRRQVIGHLRRATLINLNATPHRQLLETVFPRVRVHERPVDHHLVITQVENSLYARSYLQQRDGKALLALQRAIDGIAIRHDRVAVFCPKALEPGEGKGRLVSPSEGDLSWGHFGAQTRSLNLFSGCDAIVVAGHHMWPAFQAEALVQALRWTTRRRRRSDGPPASRRRHYAFRRADGSGRGRILHAHADPLVQATLDWSTEAEITQAIGRARAVNRPPDQAAHAYILTAAVTGLPIDHLLSLKELIYDLGQPVADSTSVRQAPLAAANLSRHAEAEERIRQAAQGLRAEGQLVTTAEIARRARADRATVRLVLGGVQADEGAVSLKISMDDGSITRPVHPESSLPPANVARHQEAEAAIRRAAAELSAAGQLPTVSAVIRLIGGSRTTVGRVLASLSATTAQDELPNVNTRIPDAPIADRDTRFRQAVGSAPVETAQGAALPPPHMIIRWAAQRGWVRLADPFSGESCEVRAHDCPAWVWQAAREARRGARAS